MGPSLGDMTANTDLPQSRGFKATVAFVLGATCVPLLKSSLVPIVVRLVYGGDGHAFRCAAQMALFVHLAPENDSDSIRRSGIKTRRVRNFARDG